MLNRNKIFKTVRDTTNTLNVLTSKKMDNVYENLKKNPAKKIRENHPNEGKKSNYPLEWGFFNKVSHKMFYKYRKRINTELTYVNMDNYQ